MSKFEFKTTRLDDNDLGSSIDDAIREIEMAISIALCGTDALLDAEEDGPYVISKESFDAHAHDGEEDAGSEIDHEDLGNINVEGSDPPHLTHEGLDAHDHSGAGYGEQVSHLNLAGIGTYTHDQIDTYMGAHDHSGGTPDGGAISYEDLTDPPGSDPAAGTAGLRTLGAGAAQAAPGDHTHTSILNTETHVNGEATALSAGELCYLKSDGKYWKVDANAAATSSGRLLVANATINAGASGEFICWGPVTAGTWTVGKILYASATPGVITETPPAGSGDVVRVIGYAISTTVFYFCPDNTWVELA
jgi:hypothetical protein